MPNYFFLLLPVTTLQLSCGNGKLPGKKQDYRLNDTFATAQADANVSNPLTNPERENPGIEGVSVTFPPGTLPNDVEVGVFEADPVMVGDLLEENGLDAIAESLSPVLKPFEVKPNRAVNPKSIQISIPVKQKDSLNLTNYQYIVLAKLYDYEQDLEIYSSFINKLILSENIISLTSPLFGEFQLYRLEMTAEVIEVLTGSTITP